MKVICICASAVSSWSIVGICYRYGFYPFSCGKMLDIVKKQTCKKIKRQEYAMKIARKELSVDFINIQNRSLSMSDRGYDFSASFQVTVTSYTEVHLPAKKIH